MDSLSQFFRHDWPSRRNKAPQVRSELPQRGFLQNLVAAYLVTGFLYRLCPGSDSVDTARDLINRLISTQERRMMKRQHVRVGHGCDRQFTCFAEPARRAAQVKSAEA